MSDDCKIVKHWKQFFEGMRTQKDVKENVQITIKKY